ncbi:related to pyruvate dehydrogenase complex protein X precursor, dihydrolipoamide acetyltransferase comp [Ramularia collo-cygni]|uniref:Related to pyruvate dehydrogenase complex protein X, dihydrolipoamide acetyltransferase comp n=1 Tax=Ramularia collo-cygni TaxID=112498 RepID=A0A2D3VLV8_9PEZI|nr:related to pyruvate dehydrogenase complex protein X precursor, dihydrolipoamide acetyltransferase comp [Ramularia collo-cygni]CZT22313.1 related to pyruvate dehydrogenase complex protein X precursor, dihydrolipoamide acetyltransferase comp [Ramularia collo-cygni]
MAGVANTARLSARFASRYAPRYVSRRGFQASAQDRAAQNYTMPALSPTMTEGSIASWKLKEGDSFSAGDVILEIETDKATMDVEAQDDGILMKIVKGDGSKGVQVGERIGVTAEPGDDISSLEMPADEQKSTKSEKPAPKKEESKAESAPEPAQQSDTKPQKSSTTSGTSKQSGKPNKQKYPLYPSVEHLLHHNGLSAADANSIPSTGPGGRLLKGDVLAYLGKINKDAPAQASARLDKLSHLDLSNIQLAKKAEAKPENKQAEKAAEPELPQETEIAMPISLTSVIATQKRVQETLGIFLPLSTFIARASELANDQLPLNKSRQPTSDELFNAVLGLDKVAHSSKGSFFPNITGLSVAPMAVSHRPSKKQDIIDILASKPAKARAPKPDAANVSGISTSDNIFSVVAKTGEEERAAAYLERMKLALEEQPGRLVL